MSNVMRLTSWCFYCIIRWFCALWNFWYFLLSSSVALQRWISSSDRGDEQAQTEQGKNHLMYILLILDWCTNNAFSRRKAYWLASVHRQEFTEYRKERGKMLLSRRNQLLLEFSFWNEPVPREGPNIYELRSYQLRVSTRATLYIFCVCNPNDTDSDTSTICKTPSLRH